MQTTTEVSNGRATLRLQARFEISTHRDFRDSCHSVLGAEEVKELELDLADVEYVDSTGLGVLLVLKEKAEIAHKRLILSNCRQAFLQLLDIANLRGIFGVA